MPGSFTVYQRCVVDGRYFKTDAAFRRHDDRAHWGARVTSVPETGWDLPMEMAASRYRAGHGGNPNRIYPPADSFSFAYDIDLLDNPNGISEYYRDRREALRRE